MKILKAELEKVAVDKTQYPAGNLPEIVLAGRSNVGKSNFINSMVNRNNLAKTSSKPGKTRTINFYKINDKFRLVDLPGYGYAKVSKQEKDKWGRIIEEYLNSRENIKEIILLVDIRHEPTELDVIMYNWIKSYNYRGLVVATKADKISKGKFQKHIKIIRDKLGIENPELIIPYSSITKINKDKVWALIGEILNKEQPS
ncbi:MAG: ribosome biogenesis GTP-binding protein YihA/YsxC [Tissierellales bacterium]